MNLKNSTLFFYSSLIAGSLLIAPIANNIERLLTDHHKELERITYESIKKKIITYEHPNFWSLCFNTSQKLGTLAAGALVNPLNYFPPASLFLGVYFKRKEQKNLEDIPVERL